MQFQQDIYSIFIVPEGVRNSDVAFDNNTKNTCMKDIKNIIEKLSGRYLFEDYSIPQYSNYILLCLRFLDVV